MQLILVAILVRDAKQMDRITRCLVGVLVAPRLQVGALLGNADCLSSRANLQQAPVLRPHEHLKVTHCSACF